jgi:HEPN domain-containing protein
MDTTVAGAAIEREAYPLCVYHCQQAVEKALKAIWVYRREDEPPRTHNLVALATELQLLRAEWQDFLRDLSEQGEAARYPYTEPHTRLEAAEYLRRTIELCRELRQHLS